jgi:thiol-disulfide isomerase/thioredoxin
MYKVLKFSATWCAPCKKSTNDIETNGLPFENIELTHYDVENNDEVVDAYGVMNIPLFVILKDNIEITRKVGYSTYTDLINWVKQNTQE